MAIGLAFPEGPVAVAGGAVLVGEEGLGRITRVEADGSTSVLAETGGAPNGLAIGPDGLLYVCNNGGLSFSTEGGVWTPLGLSDGHTGGFIQRVNIDSGEVETLFTDCDGDRLGAPNDLAFDDSGRCWFTDILRGAVIVADIESGQRRTALSGLNLPNGIGFSPDGTRLYVSETYSGNLLVASPEGGEATVLWSSHGAHGLDSLAVDRGGNICVASLGSASGVTVVSPEGMTRDLVRVPEHDEFVTNICFGGDPRAPIAYITSSSLGRLYSLPWDVPA
jgi:gluconolactonase